jgi:hypothetical protein
MASIEFRMMLALPEVAHLIERVPIAAALIDPHDPVHLRYFQHAREDNVSLQEQCRVLGIKWCLRKVPKECFDFETNDLEDQAQRFFDVAERLSPSAFVQYLPKDPARANIWADNFIRAVGALRENTADACRWLAAHITELPEGADVREYARFVRPREPMNTKPETVWERREEEERRRDRETIHWFPDGTVAQPLGVSASAADRVARTLRRDDIIPQMREIERRIMHTPNRAEAEYLLEHHTRLRRELDERGPRGLSIAYDEASPIRPPDMRRLAELATRAGMMQPASRPARVPFAPILDLTDEDRHSFRYRGPVGRNYCAGPYSARALTRKEDFVREGWVMDNCVGKEVHDYFGKCRRGEKLIASISGPEGRATLEVHPDGQIGSIEGRSGGAPHHALIEFAREYCHIVGNALRADPDDANTLVIDSRGWTG